MKINTFELKVRNLITLIVLLFSVFFYSQNSCQNYTLTIGGWGNENPQNPNYQLLHNNFAAAFPNGVRLGCTDGFSVVFTNAQAISDYLPAGSTARKLDRNYTNPTTAQLSNILVSQLLAVKLAVGIDAANPNYSSSPFLLGNQKFVSGTFAGMTVNQFLQLADNFIGDCGNSDYTASQFNAAATMINENYDGGKDGGNLSCCNLTVSLPETSINCFGSGATLTANIANASSAAQIQWYKDGVAIPGANSATLNITEGNHTFKVVVTDGSCNAEASQFVKEPAKITFDLAPVNTACHSMTTSVQILNVNGGTLNPGQNYTIVWFDASGNQVATGNPVNLPTGNYSVKVSDSKDCYSDIVNFTVNQYEPVAVTFSGTISCYGASTDLVASATGGSGTYANHIWKKLENGNWTTVQNSSSNILHNATAGQYSVEVVDDKGCTSGAVSHTLTQPTEIQISANPIEKVCYNSSAEITLNISGGTPSDAGYTVKWYRLVGNNYSATPVATGNPVNLPAGTYKAEVTDANNCVQTLTNIVVSEYPELTAVLSGQIKCNGGTATISANVNGGTGNYVTYQWTKDGQPINNNSAQLENAGPGLYTLQVWDDHHCTNAAVATLNLVEPSEIMISVDAPQVSCYNGTSHVTLSITGGTPFAAPQEAYNVVWMQGNTQVGTGMSVDLPVGSYTATVTDANNCPKTVNVNVTPLTCQNTTVTLGGWGAPANGNNWGAYREAHFATTFTVPDYLVIGDGNRKVRLTTTLAIRNFLKNGGSPAVLPAGTNVNPSGYKNTLANNVVALTLNVKFDAANPAFGASETLLGDMIVVSGPMAGSTVNQVLAVANQVLGGTSTQYSPSEINAVVDAINNNFDNGKTNNGYLACPCVTTPALVKSVTDKGMPSKAAPLNKSENAASLYPNPSKGEFNIKFDFAEEDATVMLYDMSGKLVGDISKNLQKNGSTMMLNYSNYKLTDGVYMVLVKTKTMQKTFKLLIKK